MSGKPPGHCSLARLRFVLFVLCVLFASGPAEALRLQFRADPPATFYWAINSLAGDVRSNQAGYRKALGLRPDDVALLRRFARLCDRDQPPRAERDGNGLLPLAPSDDNVFSKQLAKAFLTSRTMADVWSRARGLLRPAELAQLREIFDHFQARFDLMWKQAAYLARFTRDAASLAGNVRLEERLKSVAAAMDAPTAQLVFQVSFVFSPPAPAFSGRCIGDCLAIEVPASGTPRSNLDTVAHEAVHRIYERFPHASELMRGLFSTRDPFASQAFGLLDEGLATAIGQGMIAKILDPKGFASKRRIKNSWYVDDDIDVYAKSLFIDIDAGVLERVHLRNMAPQILRAFHRAFPAPQLTIRNVLSQYCLIAESLGPAVSSFHRLIPPRSVFGCNLAGAPLSLAAYRAQSALLAVTRVEIDRVSASERSLELQGVDWSRIRKSPGGILIRKRPVAGFILLAYGRGEAELERALRQLAGLSHVAEGWFPVP